MQEEKAAESIAGLNGRTTFLAEPQDTRYGAYRWNSTETEKLIQTSKKPNGMHTATIFESLANSR